MDQKENKSIEQAVSLLKRLTKEQQDTMKKVIIGAVLVNEAQRDKPAS